MYAKQSNHFFTSKQRDDIPLLLPKLNIKNSEKERSKSLKIPRGITR